MPDESSQAFMAKQESYAKQATRAFPDQPDKGPMVYEQVVPTGYKSPNEKVANVSDANVY